MQESNWQERTTAIREGTQYSLFESDRPLSFRRLFTLLAEDVEFADWYALLVSSFDGDACYWELPPLTTSTIDDRAEFVLLDAPALSRMRPEPQVFSKYFHTHSDHGVAVFPNLGGDALLVAPCPPDSGDNYPHLLSFLRTAPRRQVRALWQTIADALMTRLGARPVWLNTEGLGVAWLHVRLDSSPKYYHYAPYTENPSNS